MAGNVQCSYEINSSLTNEGYVTKNKKSIGNFKYHYVSLLNDVKSTLHDKPIEIYIEKQKYDQVVSEYNKWRSLIKSVFGETLMFSQNKKLDTIWSEYRKIINCS